MVFVTYIIIAHDSAPQHLAAPETDVHEDMTDASCSHQHLRAALPLLHLSASQEAQEQAAVAGTVILLLQLHLQLDVIHAHLLQYPSA